MASIRRKKHKWQAVIKRAGLPTISRSFISNTDARNWALGIEQKLDFDCASRLSANIRTPVAMTLDGASSERPTTAQPNEMVPTSSDSR